MRAVGQWKIKNLIGGIQTVLGLKPDPYDTFSWIIRNTKMASKKLLVFFMLGDANKISQRQNTYSPKMHQKIKYVGDYRSEERRVGKECRSESSRCGATQNEEKW